MHSYTFGETFASNAHPLNVVIGKHDNLGKEKSWKLKLRHSLEQTSTRLPWYHNVRSVHSSRHAARTGWHLWLQVFNPDVQCFSVNPMTFCPASLLLRYRTGSVFPAAETKATAKSCPPTYYMVEMYLGHSLSSSRTCAIHCYMYLFTPVRHKANVLQCVVATMTSSLFSLTQNPPGTISSATSCKYPLQSILATHRCTRIAMTTRHKWHLEIQPVIFSTDSVTDSPLHLIP